MLRHRRQRITLKGADVSQINSRAFHQLGIYCTSNDLLDQQVNKWRQMGIDVWSHDVSQHDANLRGEDVDVVAYMAFNYQILPGFEVELMYWEGAHQYQDHAEGIFMSHMSFYTDDIKAEEQRIWDEFTIEPYYRFTTMSHTNPRILGRERFIEAVYDTTNSLGYDIKMIQKIPWGDVEL